MHQAPFKNDPVVNAIIDELTKIYHCHTIVLYGSRARGDFTETSDYDIAGITDKSIQKQWIARYDEINHVYYTSTKRNNLIGLSYDSKYGETLKK